MTQTGFVGGDPIALGGLADLADQYAVRLGTLQATVESLLKGQGLVDVDLHPGGILAGSKRTLSEDAAELRWRAAAIDAAQAVGVDPFRQDSYLQNRAIFAGLAVFDLANWSEAFRRWTAVPTTDELRGMSPGQVAAVFAELAPHLQRLVTHQHPELVGGLDGVPAALRYSANRVLIQREIARLRNQIDQLEADQDGSRFGWLDPSHILAWFPVSNLTETVVRHLEGKVAEYRRWLEEGRQILLFDPVGDGRVVEVFGDISAASRAAVVVPGMANDMSNFSDGDGGFRTSAQRLYEASMRIGRAEIAIIAWLGYDSPDGVDASARGAARDGVPALRAFLEGIDPESDTQVTVIAHSYGSVLAGLAARQGLAANDLVFVGSPGTTLDRADQAALRPGGRIWSALARNDPIGAGISPRELPPWWVPPILAPSWLLADLANGPEELWHGTNPVSDEFGARRFTTDGSSGHSSYFEEEALLNLARIVHGLYSEVEMVD